MRGKRGSGAAVAGRKLERRYQQVLAELAALDAADPRYKDPVAWQQVLVLLSEAKALVARSRWQVLRGGKP